MVVPDHLMIFTDTGFVQALVTNPLYLTVMTIENHAPLLESNNLKSAEPFRIVFRSNKTSVHFHETEPSDTSDN